MPSNSSPGKGKPQAKAPKTANVASSGKTRDVAQIMRIVLGVLLLLNVIAAGLVLYPPGGTAEGLASQLGSLQTQVSQARARVEQTRTHTAAVQMGRSDGEEFLDAYFPSSRIVGSELYQELTRAATRAGIAQRGEAYSADLIEGSERLGMVTITANFEGSYRQLLNFIRELDQSESLLIIESLTATPQEGEDLLLVSMQLNAFVQEDEQMFLPVSDAASTESLASADAESSEVAP